MILECKNCRIKVDSEKFKRCPRCNEVIKVPIKCENCKGRSIFKLNKNKSCI